MYTTILSDDTKYDIIVVGGGTAGCALAARLSEDSNIHVLVLEAGGSGSALKESVVPAGFGKLLYDEKHVHPLRTEPQLAANGKCNYWPRAKMLGGCSSINAQMAQYGAFGDYDEWAKHTNDPSYAWSNFSKYFRKFETFLPHPNYPEVTTEHRGTAGPVKVGYFNTVSETSKSFVKACVNVGIPNNPDFNGPRNTNGAVTYVDPSFRRVSSESAYFTPDVLARPNLTVAINFTVLKILFDSSNGSGKPRATGVQFGSSKGGTVYAAHASKEVILCLGAVHTPHLLLLSGIGDPSHLASHSIPTIVPLPGVGNNLTDHPVIDLYFKDKFNTSAKFLKPQSLGDVVRLLIEVFKYKIGWESALGMNFGESAAFVRSDDPKLFPPDKYSESLKDSTSAKESPDLEIFSTPFAYKEHGQVGFDVHTFALHVYLLRPTSTGQVLLKSSDPWDQPSVNPNYISTREDISKLVRGVRLCLSIAQTAPLSDHLDASFTREDFDHFLHLKTDEELEKLVRERVETVYHPTSTCRMGREDDEEGRKKGEVVVDSKLRVLGTEGLRICDTSVFPWIVSGHTAGACFAIAEKLADEIKEEVRKARGQ